VSFRLDGHGVSADWTEEIKRAWAAGPANTLALARVVLPARMQFPHGEWMELWESGDLPFSCRKAEMLLVIGNGLAWASAQTFANLPHGWSVLYYLAQLGRRDLERMILEGAVHPRLKLREAKALVVLTGRRPEKRGKARMYRVPDKLEAFVEETLKDWSAEQRQSAQSRLSTFSPK